MGKEVRFLSHRNKKEFLPLVDIRNSPLDFENTIKWFEFESSNFENGVWGTIKSWMKQGRNIPTNFMNV